MRGRIALVLATCGLVTGTANATPRDGAPQVFATGEECMAVLYTLWRGNNVLYCAMGPNGWYIDFDDSYKPIRKGPNNK